jgi:transcriptional regulator with XRE-family HTH domain
MPKSIAVDDFAAKLALLAKRLNWSRAKLAQEVGVDKSLAARWRAGDTRPSDHTFMRLNAAAARMLPGLNAADWDLPVEQFSRRLGLAVAAGANGAPPRTILAGLRHPAKVEWGAPYLGLWAGVYQSLSNWGRPLLCVTRFAVDELGLRFSWSVGDFSGEGPALATHSHIHCIMELHPLYDRLFTLIFNAVHDTRAAVIDGLICGVGTDGTPAAGPILLLHLDDSVEPSFEALSAACGRIDERAASEAARAGDPFAVIRDLVPVDILRLICPTLGVARDGDAIDHLLRAPPQRSLGMGRLTLNRVPANEPLRVARANLRRALGLELPVTSSPDTAPASADSACAAPA